MPFFDDAGIATEQHRGQVVGAFAAFGEQVERMVAVNIAWALQLLPAAVALAFPVLPAGLRLTLVVVSSLTLVPATGALYAVAARALAGEQIDLAGVGTAVREMARPSLQALTPLFALLCALVWTVVLAGSAGLWVVDVLARAALLVLLVAASYWGPMLVERPDLSSVLILAWSAWLVWRHPGATIRTVLAVATVAATGIVTVAGSVLAVPVLLALLHTNLFERVRKGAGGA